MNSKLSAAKLRQIWLDINLWTDSASSYIINIMAIDNLATQ